MKTNFDYLVVGAGAAGMAFCDTILTQQPSATCALVDMRNAPGGHWNDAYGFVRLHQPSVVYGVQSRQLEGHWGKLMFRHWTLPWNHRASKTELLDHYSELVKDWKDQGRVEFFGSCRYESTDNGAGKTHTIRNLDNDETFELTTTAKLVDATLGECIIPSLNPPKFPVATGINVIPPNALHNMKSSKDETFCVMGCGKTGMDAVVYLQETLKVPPSRIHWVIPNDVWMIRREGPGAPDSLPKALLQHDFDLGKASLDLERQNAVTRLDTTITPTKFRFPVIGNSELKLLRRIKNVIRQGRITALEKSGNEVLMKLEKGESRSFDTATTTFVHCTSPGPFNSKDNANLFSSDTKMGVFLLFAPPVTISMSCLAALESRRRLGLLDMTFARELARAKTGNRAAEMKENKVLNTLITSYNIAASDAEEDKVQVESLIVTATFCAIYDTDPQRGLAFFKTNRLSLLSIPGSKGGFYETMLAVQKKAGHLLSDGEKKMVAMLIERLKVLEGM